MCGQYITSKYVPYPPHTTQTLDDRTIRYRTIPKLKPIHSGCTEIFFFKNFNNYLRCIHIGSISMKPMTIRSLKPGRPLHNPNNNQNEYDKPKSHTLYKSNDKTNQRGRSTPKTQIYTAQPR